MSASKPLRSAVSSKRPPAPIADIEKHAQAHKPRAKKLCVSFDVAGPFNTSQRCNNCGKQWTATDNAERLRYCDGCSARTGVDRDEAAASNIALLLLCLLRGLDRPQHLKRQ